jgi:hypothetical protein
MLTSWRGEVPEVQRRHQDQAVNGVKLGCHLLDAILLTLFGSILGIIGSVLLSVDALGAPGFLAALEIDRERGLKRMYT